ncbi:Myc-type, basic helix-loop-helix (bHLH) domain-containing protein [Cynara cardunculus var. scolymus]|uniref:Myc-type, basic helix-loop-helix (BHLH) domain-containing protein n=1 Tax=Cynara cardunculus var. scolymus TaxID=59895 RepID=A0A118JYG1_CYNCS|nr:Myc-type, basic helix-loop-helix (bHLH) domain-containing protein [Cynara cardunculus var. scolymus]
MSTRRSSYRQTRASMITDDQMADLIYKLQQLIPRHQIHTSHAHSDHKGCNKRILDETCNYIRSLQKEVEELSQRLSELLQSIDANSPQAAIVRSLLLSP